MKLFALDTSFDLPTCSSLKDMKEDIVIYPRFATVSNPSFIQFLIVAIETDSASAASFREIESS